MSMGDFTKEEANVALEYILTIYKALSGRDQLELATHCIVALLFVIAAKWEAPEEQKGG